MGNLHSVPEAHVRMYQNLLAIQSPGTRAQMIQTILSSPEHTASARTAGVYGHLLHYVQVVQAGGGGSVLPGEKPKSSVPNSASVAVTVASAPQNNSRQIQASQKGNESSYASGGRALIATSSGNDKAVNYFSACLRILELEEEVALTPDTLKAAYKKAVVRAHPDKGGSEKEFEAVTRAYAYLGEILRRIHGGRATEGKVEAPTVLSSGRSEEADKWKHVEPVALNPKNLNTKAFNDMFEKTRIPDPEEGGYGDWLKGGDSEADPGPKFGGKFNRDIFNQTFAEESKKRGQSQQQRQAPGALVAAPMELAAGFGYATELGRSAREDYTVTPFNAGLQFTDLKKAYTEYNTFSQDTANISVEARSLEDYRASREKAPGPLADTEMQALAAAEQAMAKAEEARKLRVAQEAIAEGSYFERMKRLVIKN